MTLDQLIDKLTHCRASVGGEAEIMLTVEDENDLGEFIDSPAQDAYVQAGYVFVSGVEG